MSQTGGITAWGFFIFICVMVVVLWGLSVLFPAEPRRKEPREDGLDTPDTDEFRHYSPVRKEIHETPHAQSKHHDRDRIARKVKTKYHERPWEHFDRVRASRNQAPIVVKQDDSCAECETGSGVLSAALGLVGAAVAASGDSSRMSDSEAPTGGGGSFDGGGASGSYDADSGGSTFTDTGSSCSVTPDP